MTHNLMHGVVAVGLFKAGESLTTAFHSPIVTLGDTAGLRVRVDVDEADIGKIRVGQRAYVSAQAYGEQKFWGRVVRISQMLGKKNIRTEEPTERIDTALEPQFDTQKARAGSAGGGFGERGSAEGATACRNRHIAEAFRAFFGGRVGGGFSAPHSSENRVHRQHD